MLTAEAVSQRTSRLHTEECPKCGHSSSGFESLQGSDMGVSVRRVSNRSPAKSLILRLSCFAEKWIVLLSTHIISDMEFIAGKVIIMRNGGILAIDTTERLLQEMEGKVWSVTVSHDMLRELKGRYTIGNLIQKSDGVEVRIVGDDNLIFPTNR